jgi:acyl carrier protein
MYIDSLPPGCQSKLFSRVLSKEQIHPASEKRKALQQPALLDQLSQAPPKKRRGLLEAHIREQAIKVLGLNTSFKLDLNQGLATLGMDSLMTIELKNRLQASIGKSLSSTIVFDHPTVAALAEYLDRKVLIAADSNAADVKAETRDEQAKTLTELKQLSDAEAEAVLAKELFGSP